MGETTKKPPQTKANVIACFEAIQKSEIKNQKIYFIYRYRLGNKNSRHFTPIYLPFVKSAKGLFLYAITVTSPVTIVSYKNRSHLLGLSGSKNSPFEKKKPPQNHNKHSA